MTADILRGVSGPERHFSRLLSKTFKLFCKWYLQFFEFRVKLLNVSTTCKHFSVLGRLWLLATCLIDPFLGSWLGNQPGIQLAQRANRRNPQQIKLAGPPLAFSPQFMVLRCWRLGFSLGLRWALRFSYTGCVAASVFAWAITACSAIAALRCQSGWSGWLPRWVRWHCKADLPFGWPDTVSITHLQSIWKRTLIRLRKGFGGATCCGCFT